MITPSFSYWKRGGVFMGTAEMIKDFFSVHFNGHDENAYDGNCSVFMKKGPASMLHVMTSPLSTFCKRTENLCYYPSYDYYVMANTFTQKKGEEPKLFSLENIVIDLDIHKGYGSGRNAGTETSCEDLLLFIQNAWNEGHFESDLPEVNTVVFTGRGVQVWFALESASSSLLFMYEKVADYLASKLEEFIKRYEYRLGRFTVDKAASGSPMGLFRIPCTFNTRAGKRGKAVMLTWQKRSLVDLYQCFFSQGICGRKRLKKGGYGQLAGKRMSFLNALLDHRKSLGFPIGMMRDLFCFIAYNSCIHEMDHEQALAEVYSLNDLFPDPLSKKELLGYLSTSFRKEYRISTSKMMAMLCVSGEEKKLICISNGAKERKFRHVTKEDERKMISYCKKGFNKKQIADKSGFSQTTVARILKKNRQKTRREKAALLIKTLIRNGKSVTEIRKETGEKVSVIRYYMKKSVLKHASFVMPSFRKYRKDFILTLKKIVTFPVNIGGYLFMEDG